MLALSAGSKATPVKSKVVKKKLDSSPQSQLTFTGPDVSPALVSLPLQQLRLQTGQTDLGGRKTVELGLLRGRIAID